MTGLAAGSVYHAFGDKDGLFRAAVDHHNRTVLGAQIEAHLGPGAGTAGVRAFLRAQLPGDDGDRAGCLLTQSAVELGRLAPPELAGVHAGFEQLRGAFKRVLSEARRNGVLPSTAKPAQAALRLLVFFRGLQVMVRSGLDLQGLGAAIDAEVEALRRLG